MDTVNMQKLQLLNDRIAQTIDALNQLRLSVHGIQHTAAVPWGAYPMTYGQPYGQTFGQPTFGQPTFVQPTYGQPFGQPSFVSPYNVGFGGFGNGLSHTTFEPFWQTRQTQTTPWTQNTPWTQTTPWIPTGYPVSIY